MKKKIIGLMLSLLVPIFANPKEATTISRTIEIEAFDTMAFKPNQIKVKRGETIEFVLTNKGKLKHELVIGESSQLQKHKMMMMNENKNMTDMMHHEDNAIIVDPGKSGNLVYTFKKVGKFEFACLIPGHSEAGMVGVIEVKK